MKIKLKAYTNGNLGDDLFINMIAQRYPKCSFYILNTCNFTYRNKIASNVKITEGFLAKVLSRLTTILSFNKISYDYILQRKFDLIVIIGGSMFIEGDYNNFEKKTIRKNKRYYILGCNFGPYKTQKYLESHKMLFCKAEDICFREIYSKQLFPDLPNVRYAPDIIFGLDKRNIILKNSKKVIFSIIDCSQKGDSNMKNIYINKIIELTIFFINKGYDILYMSFCKNEGDEYAIEEIINIMGSHITSKIEKYYYTGNIAEALNVMGDSQIIIGSRFHSNILGMLLGKTVIPIAYSLKMINVLKDMNFRGKFLDLNKLRDFNVDTLANEDLLYIHDISNETMYANKHFEMLDKLLLK